MGRHAGWIAAAGGLASDDTTPIPIVILFPEVTFDRDKFLAAVQGTNATLVRSNLTAEQEEELKHAFGAKHHKKD